MDPEKRVPLWKQILIVPVLAVLLAVPGLLLLGLFVWFILPPAARICPVGTFPIGIAALLALFAALFVWMLVCIVRGKHRVLAWFFAVLSVFLMIKTVPRLDNQPHSVRPELVKTYQTDGLTHSPLGPEIYYNSFFTGRSMRNLPENWTSIPEELRSELTELVSEPGYTWLIMLGEELTEISWSKEDAVQYLFFPWETGLVYAADSSVAPGDADTIYVYRIPLTPIDNVF